MVSSSQSNGSLARKSREQASAATPLQTATRARPSPGPGGRRATALTLGQGEDAVFVPFEMPYVPGTVLSGHLAGYVIRHGAWPELRHVLTNRLAAAALLREGAQAGRCASVRASAREDMQRCRRSIHPRPPHPRRAAPLPRLGARRALSSRVVLPRMMMMGRVRRPKAVAAQGRGGSEATRV